MKIGIEILDSNYSGIDLSRPDKGNPGIGGSEFSLILFAYFYNIKHRNEVYIIHQNRKNIYPDNVQLLEIEDINKIPEVVAEHQIEIYISSLTTRDDSWYSMFEKANIKIIYVANLFPTRERLHIYNSQKSVARIVFKCEEEYDRYLDDDIMDKASIIGNMVCSASMYYTRSVNLENVVTYTGALLYQKGFHVLAKQWKKILRKVPDAQLYIMGSGKLYSRNRNVGDYGITDADYEKQFIPYLLDEEGKLLESVHFQGIVGQDKAEYMREIKVGVANPTGETETFCNSAVEFATHGVPVVTVAKNSFLSVISHGKSGLLFHTEFGFRHYIIKLLKNDTLNRKMGVSATEYAKRFAPDVLLPKWEKLFAEIENDIPSTYLGSHGHIFFNRKWLTIINHFLRFNLQLRKLPSRMGGKK